MRRRYGLLLLPAAIVVAISGGAASHAAVVTVPATLTFQVTDPSVATTGTPNPFVVSYTESLENAYVNISVHAGTTLFSPTSTGAGASDVSWTTINSVGGVGGSGILSIEPLPVFVSNTYQSGGSVELVWTLAALPPGSPAGTYTLELYWSFEVTDLDPPGGDS